MPPLPLDVCCIFGFSFAFGSFDLVPDNTFSEVGKYYGHGTKYKSVWDRMSQINKNGKVLKAAVEAGQDPFKVPLTSLPSEGKGNTYCTA